MSKMYLHCGIHKAATTYFRMLFCLPSVRLKSPVRNFAHYETQIKDRLNENYFEQTISTIPQSTLVYCMCCSWSEFKKQVSNSFSMNSFKGTWDDIPFKAFYVYRDPREIVVSSYYSWLKSHGGGHGNRKTLQQMNLEDGLIWTIDWLKDKLDCFSAMLDWHMNCIDRRVLCFPYELFFENDKEQIKNTEKVLRHFDIKMSDEELKSLHNKLDYKKLSGGRKRGEVDTSNHFRSAKPDTWRSIFSPKVLKHYYLRQGKDVHQRLGYAD